MRDKAVVHKLFEEAQIRFGDRAGGYTKVVKIGWRQGDAAPISLVELVTVQEKQKGKKTIFIVIPMVFMLGMTLWALAQLIYQSGFNSIGIISTVLLILAIILVVEAVKIVFLRPSPATN